MMSLVRPLLIPSVVRHHLRLLVPACLAAVLGCEAAAAPLVLLRDSFNGIGSPDTMNLNYNLSGRQTGALAPVPFTRSGNVQVGNGGEPHDGGNVLLCAFGGNGALDYNFNGPRSAGGLKISFDLDPNSHTDHSDITTWGSVALGSSEANRNTFVVSGTPHFGILFRANGRLQAFDGGAGVSPNPEPNWLPDGNYSGQFHHVDIVCTGPGDGNPFDGSGDTTIEVFVDGGTTPVYSFTKAGGYADNYVNFGGEFIANFENVTLSRLNPAGPVDPWRVVGWSGDGDSEIQSSDTYTHAYNFGSANSVTINGVTFTGVNGGNPAVGGSFSVTGIPNSFGDDGGNNVGGNSITLARSFIYGGNPGTLTLQGLTPGAPYVLTLYSKAWDPSGNRVIKCSAGGTQRVIDQDTYGRNDGQHNGIRIVYAYTADGSGSVTVNLTPVVAANSMHLYGFSNRQGTPSTSAWSYAEWTSDATSGLEPNTYVYTHAYNLGSASTATVNGLPFTGNAAQNPATAGSYAAANFFASYGGGYVPEITGGGQALANQFIYDGRPGTLTLQGLTPGRGYVLSLFSASFGGPGRLINFLANGQLQTIDQDAHTGNRGIVIQYPYTAGAGGTLTVQMFTMNPGWSFHLCGYANREAEAAPAPTLVAQPQDTVGVLGGNAQFSVVAAGIPPLGYTWYFGGSAIPGATAATLAVPVDSAARAGFYQVVVANNFGSVTSRLAELIVRAPIPGLFNTGVDGSGNALADNAVDPHYTLLVNADSASTDAIVQNGAAFPIVTGPWLANTATGKWIGPWFDTSGAAGQAQGGGLYVYRTTVDLTGLDYATAEITGGWAVDNDGLEIRVNGVSTGQVNANGFGGLTSFTLNSANAAFTSGLNTIDFVVRNADAVAGYTGLRVGNLVGTVTLPGTPPRIVTQPQSHLAGTGESHTFAVTASGSSPLSYQWKHAGTNLPGATARTLVLAGITHDMAGAYQVLVSNPGGATNSAVVTLTVRDSVPGLFNTGVGADHLPLADGAVDSHYQLLVNPDSASADALVIDSTVFPIVAGPWVANDAAGKWIGPRVETSAAAAGGYTYRLTFDLTGFDLGSIDLTGEWTTDNNGLDIVLNGQSTGNANLGGFASYSAFRITNGFLAGPNTLDFRMTNDTVGYTGLRVRNLRGLATLLPAGTPPVVLQQPQPVLANYGDTVTFLVRANGALPLEIQWLYEGVEIPGAVGASFSVLVDFPDLAGLYSARVTSGVNSVTSQGALLSINNPPFVPAKGGATSVGQPMLMLTSKLLREVVDQDGDSFVLESVATTSLQGGMVTAQVGGYLYAPPAGFVGTDSVELRFRDSRGGLGLGAVVIAVVSGAAPSENQVLMLPVANGMLVRFAGIPGRTYEVQRSGNLSSWTTLNTVVAPPHGLIDYVDTAPLPGQGFYRTVLP